MGLDKFPAHFLLWCTRRTHTDKKKKNEMAGEGEDVCRICRSEGERFNRLIATCACQGSIKYSHTKCLKRWISHSGHTRCEICGIDHEFVDPCHQIILNVLLRASNPIAAVLLLLFNMYAFTHHPWGQDREDFSILWKYVMAGLTVQFWTFNILNMIILIRLLLVIAFVPGMSERIEAIRASHFFFLHSNIFKCLLLSVYMSGSFIIPNIIGIYVHMVLMGLIIVCGGYIPRMIYVLAVKIWMLPLLLGLWFTFCLLSGFGLTSWMLQLLFDFPLTIFIAWLLGFLWLQLAFKSMCFVQSILAFPCLLDVTNAAYGTRILYLRSILSGYAFHGAVMIFVLLLPLKTVCLISSFVSPIPLCCVSDLSTAFSSAGYVSLVIVGAGAFRIFYGHILVRMWITTLCSWLDLTILTPLQQENRRINAIMYFDLFALLEGSFVDVYGSHGIDNQWTGQKKCVMFVLALLSLYLGTVFFLSLPFLVGRALLEFYLLF